VSPTRHPGLDPGSSSVQRSAVTATDERLRPLRRWT